MVLLLENMDAVKAKQMRMFRDNTSGFWEEVLESILESGSDSVEEPYRMAAMLAMRFSMKWDEEWIARAFDIDISNASRTLAKGVRMMRGMDREMLTRSAVDVVTLPVDVVESLIEGSKMKSFTDPLLDDSIRKALNALDAASGRGDELSE